MKLSVKFVLIGLLGLVASGIVAPSASATSCGLTSAIAADLPILWYNFSGSAPLSDLGSSGVSANLSGTTAPLTGVAAVCGQAQTFQDGQGKYKLSGPFPTGSLNDASFTVETVVKYSAQTSVWGPHILRMVDYGANRSFFVLRFRTDPVSLAGKLELEFHNGTTTSQSYTSSRIDDGQWHHVVLTVEPGKVKFYVDGALSSTTSATTTNLHLDEIEKYIGGSEFTTESLVGSLDELAIYDSTFSSAKVLSHFGTYAALPDAPTLRVVSHASGAISLAVTAPNGNGRSVTDFRYQTSIDGTNWIDYSDAIDAGLGLTVSSLTNGVRTYFRSASVTSAGQSSWSNTVSEYPSSAPSNLVIDSVVNVDRSVGVTVYVDSNGATITSLTATYALNGGSTQVLSLNAQKVGQVPVQPLGTSVIIAVNAINRDGTTTASKTVIIAALPSAPVLQVTGHARNSVSLAWTEPSNGGIAIDEYEWASAPTNTSDWTTAGNSNVLTSVVDSLSVGQVRKFRVRAHNSNGWGAWSNEVIEYASTTCSVYYQISHSGDWTANASLILDPGGSPTTANFSYKIGSGAWVNKTSSTSETFILGVVAEGTLVNFKANCSNRDGQTAWVSSTWTSVPERRLNLKGVTSPYYLAGESKLPIAIENPCLSGGCEVATQQRYALEKATSSGWIQISTHHENTSYGVCITEQVRGNWRMINLSPLGLKSGTYRIRDLDSNVISASFSAKPIYKAKGNVNLGVTLSAKTSWSYESNVARIRVTQKYANNVVRPAAVGTKVFLKSVTGNRTLGAAFVPSWTSSENDAEELSSVGFSCDLDGDARFLEDLYFGGNAKDKKLKYMKVFALAGKVKSAAVKLTIKVPVFKYVKVEEPESDSEVRLRFYTVGSDGQRGNFKGTFSLFYRESNVKKWTLVDKVSIVGSGYFFVNWYKGGYYQIRNNAGKVVANWSWARG
jgi:hypothetical protein